MRIRWAVALMLCIPAGAQAQQEAVSVEGCEDEFGLCDSRTRREKLAPYGFDEAEAEAKRGVTLRRFIVWDHWGQHLVAGMFFRAPGQSPQVEIFSPDRSPDVQPLRAAISQQAWQRVLDLSSGFEHRLAGEPRPSSSVIKDGDKLIICFHPQAALIEAVDQIGAVVGSRRVERGPLVRRNDGNSCTGLAWPVAQQMAQVAIENLPECSTILPTTGEQVLSLLETCRALGGDRMAAGEVYRQLTESRFPHATPGASMFPFSGSTLQAFETAMAGCDLLVDGVEARDSDHAEVAATLFCREQEPYSRATMQLRMFRDDDRFVVSDFTVSERRPIPETP